MDAWTFCKSRLGEVSRSFAVPIGMLRDRLERAVTCGYLLCRVIDTVEDDEGLDAEAKEALFDAFLDALEGRAPVARFEAAFRAASTFSPASPEHHLARELGQVMAVVGALPPRHVATLRRWVAEMARGMALYTRRTPDADGLITLTTLSDLERYCYFVAGTVGHLLTDLFLEELGPLDAQRALTLRSEAEEFGVGLQLVNILKDITDDRARGWSFIPHTVFARLGLAPADALAPEHRAAAHDAVAPIFDRADRGLEAAFRYTLAIPAAALDVRVFCLLPLWMAVRTLATAKGSDAQFIPGQAVKIDRAEVAALVADCRARAGDDAALRVGFEALRWGAPAGGGRETAAAPAPLRRRVADRR